MSRKEEETIGKVSIRGWTGTRFGIPRRTVRELGR